MKKIALVLALVIGFSGAASADILLGWSFSGTTGIGTQVANDVISATLDSGGIYNTLTRGAGAGSSSGNSSFRTTGFKNEGISVSSNDYFQFIMSAAPGYTLSLGSITGVFVGTTSYYLPSTGVSDQWAYSFDGSSFTLIESALASTNLNRQWDFSGVSALQNVDASSDVYLRYYASGQTTSGGWGFGSAGIDVNGTIQEIPEPGVLALLGIGTLALIRLIRRRK